MEIKTAYGKCEYEFEKDYVHIFNLFVLPVFRNKGRATQLLRMAINSIRETGYSEEIQIVAMPAEPCIDRERLKAFYARMGLIVFDYYG